MAPPPSAAGAGAGADGGDPGGGGGGGGGDAGAVDPAPAKFTSRGGTLFMKLKFQFPVRPPVRLGMNSTPSAQLA